MEDKLDERSNKIIDKADFYFKNKIDTHIVLIPHGFRNGRFESELIDNTFFWFFDFKYKERIRLFISEIYNILDYKEKKGDSDE